MSLRVFAAILGILAIGGLWIVVPAYWQLIALTEIEQGDGHCELHVRGPRWLREILGREWSQAFAEVDEVYLSTCGDDVRIAAQINRFPSLRILHFGYCEVSDDGLLELRDLTMLESITVDSERVTDAGMPALERLTNLRTLWLHNARVTDDGLRHLAGLTNLTTLALESTPVTGTGFAHLKTLSDLETLGLAASRVNDKALLDLGDLASLHELDIRATLITDAGLRNLKRLKNLKRLRVGHTRVTDAGINDLRNSIAGLWIDR